MDFLGGMINCPYLGASPGNIGTNHNVALSSANSGEGWRFVAPASLPLVDVYIFTTASSGAAGNVTVQLRAYGSSATVPAAGNHSTVTAAWNGTANRWNKYTFGSPFTVTAGVVYWVTIANADGSPATNFPTVQGSLVGQIGAQQPMFLAHTTSNAWTSGTPTTAGWPTVVLRFTDGTTTILYGVPYTQTANYASNQLRRGLRIESLDSPVTVFGVRMNVPASMGNLEFYEGTTAPAGTLVRAADAFPTNSQAGAQGFLIPDIKLKAGTNYRVVTTFTGNSTTPAYWNIQDGSAYADLQAAGYANNMIYGTIDNGSGGWTDDRATLPRMCLLTRELVRVTRASRMTGGAAC